MRVQESKFRLERLAMAKRDQAMRKGCILRGKPWDSTIDLRNTRRMKLIVQRYGWPTMPMVGKRAAMAAWLLVQHADRDVAWQERCLALLGAAAEEGTIERWHWAFLTDRVRVGRGKPQIYGTQFHTNARGKAAPRPIRDRKHLDVRRRAVGLSKFGSDARVLQTRVARGKQRPPPQAIRAAVLRSRRLRKE